MGKFDQRAEEFGLLVGLHDSARRVEDLPLDWIMADPENPRRVFDETELKDLAASIAARGVLQPIIVAPKNGDGLHVIRVGERRFRASRLAGRETIPAIVMAVVNRADTLADQIVENDQRAGLTPHDLATGIERMLGAGVTQAEIARALGRSKQFVSLYAACADMAPWLRAAIDQMPIRLLYDLHRAARTHGDAVRAYVQGLLREDIVQLDAAADARGLKRTEWLVMLLRRRLHATSPPPRGDRVLIAQSWRELNRIGINLNQAVHALHAATMVDSRLDLAREAARVASFRDEVADQLRVLGRALKGDMAYWDTADE